MDDLISNVVELKKRTDAIYIWNWYVWKKHI